MNELSLFSGVGGGLLGTKLLGWRTLGYVESNNYCQRIIKARIEDGIFDKAPIFGDISTFISEGYAKIYKGLVDVITGGFPCQPFSTASHGRKTARDMWPEMRETIDIIRPKYIFAENVQKEPIECAERDLRCMGYGTKKISLSARDVGADHIRKRYWLFGYPNNDGESMCFLNDEAQRVSKLQINVWKSNSSELRMVDGMAYKLDRLKAIGNGQIPAVVAEAWMLLNRLGDI